MKHDENANNERNLKKGMVRKVSSFSLTKIESHN